MAIAYRAIGAAATGTTSVTCSQPSGTVNDDILIAIIVDRATSGTTSAPTGWTRQGGAAGTGGRIQVFTAVVGRNGLTGTSWAFSGLSTRAIGRIIGCSGGHGTTILDAAMSARINASGTVGCPGITPVTYSSWVVGAFASLANSSTWSAEETAITLTFTERADSAYSSYLSLAVCEAFSPDEATGDSMATMATAAANAAAMIAIRPAVAATVTTQAVSDITATTATGNGNVTEDGGHLVTERGVCWNTTGTPTTADSKATASGTTGAYTANMTGLSASTHYYVRAYAITGQGASYGSQVEFDSASSGAYTDSVADTGIAVSAIADLQTFADGALSTAAAVSAITDAAARVDDIGTTGVSAGTIADNQTYVDSVLSSGSGLSTVADAVVFVEAVLSTAVSTDTISDQQAYAEGALSAAASQSTTSDVQAFLDAAQTVIASASSLTDVSALIDNLQSTGISVSSAGDIQAYIDTVNSIIVSTSTISDAMAMLEAVNSLAGSSSTVADALGGSAETIQSIIISVSALGDLQQFADTLSSMAQSGSDISDALTSLLETYNTAILSLSTIEDRQLMVDNIEIMAQSGVAIADIMQYLDQIQTAATSGAGVQDVLVGAFIGRYIHGHMAKPRTFTARAERCMTTQARSRSSQTSAACRAFTVQAAARKFTTMAVRQCS